MPAPVYRKNFVGFAGRKPIETVNERINPKRAPCRWYLICQLLIPITKPRSNLLATVMDTVDHVIPGKPNII